MDSSSSKESPNFQGSFREEMVPSALPGLAKPPKAPPNPESGLLLRDLSYITIIGTYINIYIYIWETPKIRGPFLVVLINKSPTILGSTLGPPLFWKLPIYAYYTHIHIIP